jgi:hypothetical protein
MVGVRRVRMVDVRRVRMVAVRSVAVRKVPMPWKVPVRSVAVEEELAAAGCAHAVRGDGAFGIGVGGSGGGGLQRCAVLSHRAALLEEDKQCYMGVFGQHGFR